MNSITDFMDERELYKAPMVKVRYTEEALAEDGSNAAFAKGCTVVYDFGSDSVGGHMITKLHKLGIKTIFISPSDRDDTSRSDEVTAKTLGVQLDLAPSWGDNHRHLCEAVENEAKHDAFRWLSGETPLPEPMASNALMRRAVAHAKSELQAKRIDANTLKDIVDYFLINNDFETPGDESE